MPGQMQSHRRLIARTIYQATATSTSVRAEWGGGGGGGGMTAGKALGSPSFTIPPKRSPYTGYQVQ